MVPFFKPGNGLEFFHTFGFWPPIALLNFKAHFVALGKRFESGRCLKMQTLLLFFQRLIEYGIVFIYSVLIHPFICEPTTEK